MWQKAVLLWKNPGGTSSSWAWADTPAVEKKMYRGSCTTELYSQNGFFLMQNGTWPKIFTEQKRFQEHSQLKLERLPVFSQERPQTLVASTFSSPGVQSLNCPMQIPHSVTKNVVMFREIVNANGKQTWTIYCSCSKLSSFYRETVICAFWGLGSRKRKIEQITACCSRQLRSGQWIKRTPCFVGM